MVASFLRLRRPVCERCGAQGLFAPVAPRKTAEILSGAHTTRRRALRTLGAGGATVAATAAGLGAAVFRNRGWLPVANDFFVTKVENTAPHRAPGVAARAPSRATAASGAPTSIVSDISLGSGRINDAQIAAATRSTAASTTSTPRRTTRDTGSEQLLGEAMKGRRDKVFLATKFCVADGHLPNDTPVPEIIAAVEGSLQPLQTDHVDLIHIHSCDRVERLMAPNIHEAFDRLKEQGKVRFLGVSTHTPNLEEVANAAIDSGRFDVMMLAYHFGMWPSFAHILEKAKQTRRRHRGDEDAEGRQAHQPGRLPRRSRRVLAGGLPLGAVESQRLVPGGLVLRAAARRTSTSTPPAPSRRRRTSRCSSATISSPRGDYCQPHCGLCLDSCPEQLAINDVLRYRMYFRDYGWEKEGMRLYAKLDRNASRCVTCPAPCTGTCPIGVPIREKMLDAHRVLTL